MGEAADKTSRGFGRRRGLLQTRQYGPRRRPGPRRTAAPSLGPDPRCIAALRIDGGTAFGVWTDPGGWCQALRAMVHALTSIEDPIELERMRRDHPLVTLPLPRLPETRQRGLAGILDPECLDYRTRGFGPDDGAPVAEVTLGGRNGKFVVLHFHDRAYVQIGERLNVETGEVQCYVRVEAKHRELYADGERQWMRRWLGLWSWLLFGKWTEPENLMASHGWAVTQLHLNSDFVGVSFDDEDESDFLAARKRELCGLVAEEDDYPDDAWQTPWLQTVNLGRKTSDVQLCIYRKGDQLREEKRLDPRNSAYAALWLAMGWKPESDGDPTRVEFRLRKKGLQFRRRDAGDDDPLAYDFRDPALLLDPVAKGHLWRHVAEQRRLVQRAWDCTRCSGTGRVLGRDCSACEGSGRIVCTRIRRAPTDPRWKVVESAAGITPDFDLAQVRHRVAELTRVERQARAWRSLSQAARTIAMMDENLDIPHSRENLAAYLENLAARIRASDVPVDYESAAPASPIPSPMDVGTDFIAAKCNFFSAELVDEPRTDGALSFLERRGAHGVRRAFCRPPPTGENDEPENTGPPTRPTDRPNPGSARARAAHG